MPRGKVADPNSLPSKIVDYVNSQHDPVAPYQIAEALGVHQTAVSKRLSDLYTSGRIDKSRILRHGKKQVAEPEPTRITEQLDTRKTADTGIEGFRRLFDKSLIIPETIKDKIENHLKQKGWDYDDNFRVVCGVKQHDWRRFRSDFAHLHVTVEGRLVWGHPDIIDEMREIMLR
jgi:DNA-binding transcriptional ArsR family regulator